MDHAAPPTGEPARTEPVHGGRLLAARRAFPAAPTPWIDLSTGMNPHPWPVPALPPESWTRLPEPEQVQALERAALAAYGAQAGWHAVAAPGTSVLIACLPSLFPGPAAILGPTYGEHHASWPAAIVVPHLNEAFRQATVRIVCQPDNPTGVMQDAADLLHAAAGGTLIADESYADFTPGAALEQATEARPGLIVLRSFGKAYGLAGLRLGFALTDRVGAATIRRALGPWPVSGPAVAIGTAALADSAWHGAAARRLASDRTRLDATLHHAGLAGTGTTPLFAFVSPAAPGWFGHLARRGILVRAFPDRPTALRIGLPPADAAAWDRVAAALDARRTLNDRTAHEKSGPSTPTGRR